jgi:hypothetical protein
MISGDRLYTLDAERLAILKRVLPAYGETARPLDLFESPLAEVFGLEIRRPFERWWLVGCFNHSQQPKTCRPNIARLGLDAKETYLVYDFWSQRLIGELTEGFTVELEPTSASLLAIRKKTGAPQLLSTDRHITQGGVELADVRWDAEKRTLAGTARGGPGMNWVLSLYVPEGFTWRANDPHPGLVDISFERPVLRARIDFGATSSRDWSVSFTQD